ncbi:uncharacterized protein LOC128257634 [Drosophila gunungcola]|uniref:CG17361-PA n=1 Tax=Drosophila gunungcola TaxID=103775 RepID=A0A9P9YQ36_9MUSC|nr:uncharacterized protein LOC128257634 [Drosophila gunungcola]KAI8041064.1 hypothetical protein M5D96_005315 [Drosophila gunungcola]
MAMEDLMKMCRVCMGEAEDLVDINDNKSMGDGLSADLKLAKEPEPTPADLLKKCCPFPISSDDGFPMKVCEPCLKKMRVAHQFRRRYAKNIAYLERVKEEQKDQETLDMLETEDWGLVDRIKSEAEEEEDEYENLEPKKKKPKLQAEKPRPFKCPDCPKSFTGKAQLTMHSRTHTKGSRKTSTRPKRRSIK